MRLICSVNWHAVASKMSVSRPHNRSIRTIRCSSRRHLTRTGFVVSAATNHSLDYTYGGMEATMRELDDREFPYAGVGRNLTEARKPAHVDTTAGRVAVASACSTLVSGSAADEPGTEMKRRPGVSPLRWKLKDAQNRTAVIRTREISMTSRYTTRNNVTIVF